jgi:hypothetical protein
MAKWYVYTLSYPPALEGGAVFYVGKGQGPRMHTHEVSAAGDGTGPRSKTIQAIWDAGYQIVKAKVLETDDELEALDEERRLIGLYTSPVLTNIMDNPARPRPSQVSPYLLNKRREREFYAADGLRMIRVFVDELGMTPSDISRAIKQNSSDRPKIDTIERVVRGLAPVKRDLYQSISQAYVKVTGRPSVSPPRIS